jgi:hypothetical protein
MPLGNGISNPILLQVMRQIKLIGARPIATVIYTQSLLKTLEQFWTFCVWLEALSFNFRVFGTNSAWFRNGRFLADHWH